MVDGYLKIKTKLDNSEIPKGVKELEDKIKKIQTDNTKQSGEQRNLENEINAYERLAAQAESYRQKIKELDMEKSRMLKENPQLVVGEDSSELINLKNQLESIKQKYNETSAEIVKQGPKIDNVYAKLDKVKAKQAENNQKIAEYKQKIESIKTSHVENSINNVGKGITKQISAIGKMVIGIASIRTAWGAVRSAINLVSQYNTQVSTNLDYMKFCLANAIAPAIQRLINLAMILLSYINAITSAWFGINLFSNASAKNFKKAQQGASGVVKAVKEADKSMQSFDEANVMSDTSNSGSSGGGAGGVSMPNMDLSSLQAPIPEWLQWIIDNKDLILQLFTGIIAGVLAIKLGLDGIKALGIGVLVAGIVGLINSLIDYFNDPTWENFGSVISNIGLILLGLGIIIGNVPLIIAGVIAVIVGLIASNWENIQSFLQGGIDWLFSQMDWVRKQFGIVGVAIYTAFLLVLQNVLNALNGWFNGVKTVLNGIMQVFRRNFYRRYENSS